MRDDFAAFILTHQRPHTIYTLEALADVGYTGRIYLVVDDADPTLDVYREKYGDNVLTFSKENIAERFDEGDNFRKRQSIFYARNACFDLAGQIGVRYFIELDDDYTTFDYALSPDNRYLTQNMDIKQMDRILEALVDFLASVPYVSTVAFAQGGDFIGGADNGILTKAFARKAMNTFICDAERPFPFRGKINEDVNTYTEQSRSGLVLLTYPRLRMDQKRTQTNPGGMTDLYLDAGTYVKSFYSVMYAPSCVTIRDMGRINRRLHHRVDWNAAAPKILPETARK